MCGRLIGSCIPKRCSCNDHVVALARPRNTTHSNLAEYHETDGDTLYLHCGVLQYFMRPLVITRDPRNVEYMLKTSFDNFPKGEAFHDSVHELLGDGIFNADGDLWYKQRKTASQMFTASRFKNHIWRLGWFEGHFNLL